jgi:hypothetical protein
MELLYLLPLHELPTGHFCDVKLTNVKRGLYIKLLMYFKQLTFYYDSLSISSFSTAVMYLSGSSDRVTAWRHFVLPAKLNMQLFTKSR